MALLLPPDVQAVMGMVDGYIQWKQKNSPPRGHEMYHPSAFGKCLRLMQYQRYSERGYIPTPEESPESSMCRIWDNGHSMHDRWRGYFTEMGVLRGYWICTNPLCAACDDNGNHDNTVTIKDVQADPHEWLSKRRLYGQDNLQGAFKPEQCVCGWKKFKFEEPDVIDQELNFSGHADGILDFSRFDPEKYFSYVKKPSWSVTDLPTSPIVVDMKSINNNDFQDVAKGSPSSDYEIQLTIYANILDCEFGLLLYENKNNQRTTSFKIEKNADTWWPEIRRQALLMNEMANAEDEEGNPLMLLPPPRYSNREHLKCNYCLYKDTCHTSAIWDQEDFNEKRLFFYGDLL